MGGDWLYLYHLQTTVVLLKLLVTTKCNNFLVDPSSPGNFAMIAKVGTKYKPISIEDWKILIFMLHDSLKLSFSYFHPYLVR